MFQKSFKYPSAGASRANLQVFALALGVVKAQLSVGLAGFHPLRWPGI
jgi:hypothetical protein